ncbi:MAG TPA: hypothetical protein VIK01_04755 [Polyangiaceae bacterium]
MPAVPRATPAAPALERWKRYPKDAACALLGMSALGRLLPVVLLVLGCHRALEHIVTGRVTDVSDSAESIEYKHVTISFSNPTAGPCDMTRYSLAWPGGRKEVEVKVTLPLGASKRTVAVGYDSGNIKTLTPASTRVAVFSRCAAHEQRGAREPFALAGI